MSNASTYRTKAVSTKMRIMCHGAAMVALTASAVLACVTEAAGPTTACGNAKTGPGGACGTGSASLCAGIIHSDGSCGITQTGTGGEGWYTNREGYSSTCIFQQAYCYGGECFVEQSEQTFVENQCFRPTGPSCPN